MDEVQLALAVLSADLTFDWILCTLIPSRKATVNGEKFTMTMIIGTIGIGYQHMYRLKYQVP